ncbi:DUF1203 domain-containing protein [Microlunatus soli]|uniref:DUF1203 domain-containing protein n=1 Tax=Microlunatus soli TaxID=630515 RepID=A0A1H1VHM2_9ACTN|nr:DUF1203 domain-containing protein [Microlunatus soli]SDS83796.1 Protein of unknown function [Microlunatus soli]
MTSTAATGTDTTTRYLARAIPAAALRQLRRTDDSGRPLRPFVAGAADAPIDSVGSPLRCCLRGIRSGERVALVSYAPLRRWAAATGADPGGYDEAGPVFIHTDECAGPRDLDGYPHARTGALRAIRRYDANGHIVGGQLVEIGADPTASIDEALDAAFSDPEVALVHVRAVEYGCFHFEVRRLDRTGEPVSR